MGSQGLPATNDELPLATSEELTLAYPTEAEKVNIWTMNHREWGGALSLRDYLRREPFQTTIPLSRDGGLSFWILTGPATGPDRPVYASCEAVRKPALVATPEGELRESFAFGVGSVYTPPAYRGHRYASRMLTEVSQVLRTWQWNPDAGRAEAPDAPCATGSMLWSDIGKCFYAKLGWAPYASAHASFPASSGAGASETGDVNLKSITFANLGSYCKRDVDLLRKQMSAKSPTGKTRFAFLPSEDQMLWHLKRSDFISRVVFGGDAGKADTVGAVAGADGARVWVIWTRVYGGPLDRPDGNKLYILRLVVEDETAPKEDLLRAFRAVIGAAQVEAARWKLSEVHVWNPARVAKKLVDECEISHECVEREQDHIASLMWHSDQDSRNVEWVANEFFCWC